MRLTIKALFFLSLFPSSESFHIPARSHKITKAFQLDAVSRELVGMIDGSNYNALELFTAAEGNSVLKDVSVKGEKIGIIKIVAGSTDENPKERIVGVAVDPDSTNVETVRISSKNGGIHLQKDSVAVVPRRISDEDAMSTLFASLTGVHCAFHDPIRNDGRVVEGVGGSNDDFMVSSDMDTEGKKVVILGGGEYSCFITDSIATLGGDAQQITANTSLKPRKNVSNVKVNGPGIGEEEFSFSSIMNFDALVDTLSDETKLGEAACRGLMDSDAILGANEECSSSVIKLLQRQNRCNRYISTMTAPQQKVRDEGIIWGRGKANDFTKDANAKASSTIRKHLSTMHTPKRFGRKTLQPLLDAGVVFQRKAKDNVLSHSWNLQDFWELLSWPRDAEGGNIRFGLPVVEDIDSLEMEGERMISAPPSTGKSGPATPRDEFAGKKNPFVVDINDLKELSHEVIEQEKDCVLFLSAAYCRTCKKLSPQYTKLARDHAKAGNGITFAKANTAGKLGKDVVKAMGVDSVPAFAFFKDGKRYGSVISISKMPSKKLDVAIDLLLSGGEWDKQKVNFTP
ncbi:hypothetical protein CTEN210_08236 [Chaetoceros tenuissimus]|uniref:Thioredoxin domain-containing protein n=1 Tax=Chaetoceros tenuissimus TaxID=426638 RepID=A0AAD3CVF8_9STRA|nr:hypothetical protein CTEN210_08236 [Chaetoceros tenuissimus]